MHKDIKQSALQIALDDKEEAHMKEKMDQLRWNNRIKCTLLKEKEDLKSKNDALFEKVSNLQDESNTQVLVYFTCQICLLFTDMAGV